MLGTVLSKPIGWEGRRTFCTTGVRSGYRHPLAQTSYEVFVDPLTQAFYIRCVDQELTGPMAVKPN